MRRLRVRGRGQSQRLLKIKDLFLTLFPSYPFNYNSYAIFCSPASRNIYTFVPAPTMKKLFVAILAILYISTSTGATVYTHYCMGKLADWGLGHNKSSTCGNCGMEKNNGCCKDEHKFIKNEADQKVVESFIQLMEFAGVALHPGYAELSLLHISSVSEENPASNSPPRHYGVAVYIFSRNLLI